MITGNNFLTEEEVAELMRKMSEDDSDEETGDSSKKQDSPAD